MLMVGSIAEFQVEGTDHNHTCVEKGFQRPQMEVGTWVDAPHPAMPHHTAWVCFCELELPEPSSQALGTDLHAHPVFTPRKSSLPCASSLDDTGCEHPGAPTAVRGRAGGLARGCPQHPLSWAAGGLVWPAPPRGSVRDCPARLGPQGSPSRAPPGPGRYAGASGLCSW